MITKYTLKDGSERFEVDFYLGISDQTGKVERVRKKGFKSYAAAKKYSTKIKYEYSNNLIGTAVNSEKIRFEDVYRLWFKQYVHTVRENTYITTLQVADNHILPKFKKYYMNSISVEMCQDIANEWYSGFAKATMLVSIVNRMFKFAIGLGYCRDNPMSKIMRPRNTHKKEYEAPFYTKQELQHFFKCIEEESPLRQTILRVLAFTGLRRGEIMALMWKDIDMVNNTLSVNRVLAEGIKGSVFHNPKTKKSRRTISIDKATMDMLKWWRVYQKSYLLKYGINILNNDEQFVFTNKENKHLNLYYLGTLIPKLLAKYDLPHINAHGFRHTHCSLLFEAGLDMQEVRDRLGHSNIETTMNIYAHVTTNRRDNAADKFENFMDF